MIYRRPGFLEVIRFGSSPTLFPLSHQLSICLSLSVFYLTGEERGEGVGEEPKFTTARKPGLS
jgi:hypothetical protein